MYRDYFSVEQFMRDHQRELLAAAAHARQARAAARAAALRASWERAARGAAQHPALLVRTLAGVGRGLVALGRRLEAAAAARTRPRDSGICKEQPTAAGC